MRFRRHHVARSARIPRFRRHHAAKLFIKLVVIGYVVSIFLKMNARYMDLLPNLTKSSHDDNVPNSNSSYSSCKVFDGYWMVDSSYPLYNASECPFIENGFNCLGNGRTDNDYLKWRWKPKNCDIPRFSARSFLQMFQNKTIVFAGDSMSRTQWESLICMLMTLVDYKRSFYEVKATKITKQIRILGVRFSSFNLTIEFFRSVSLVHHSWAPKPASEGVRSTLKLHMLDDTSNQWVNSDVLIFNSGQWWVPGKLFETNQIPRLCNITSKPLFETEGKDSSLYSDTVFEVVKNMKVPITVLHITLMSALRSDAHVGIWSDGVPVSGCSDWCLPGVPDMWNEILLSYLLPSFKEGPSDNVTERSLGE